MELTSLSLSLCQILSFLNLFPFFLPLFFNHDYRPYSYLGDTRIIRWREQYLIEIPSRNYYTW